MIENACWFVLGCGCGSLAMFNLLNLSIRKALGETAKFSWRK